MADSHADAKVTLARAAVALGSRGLHDWDNFLLALRDYDRETLKLFAQSPIEQLQNFQGRAQMVAQLLAIFENCKKIAETAEQKKVTLNERRL